MTREEAIKMLEYIRYTGNGESEYKHDAQSIAIDMAIKALEQNTVSEEEYTAEYTARKQAEYELWKIKEQQPSEDCVNRQAGLDVISRIGLCKCSTKEVQAVDECLRAVEALPPVTPQPKTGHWIRMKAYEKWGCSECSTVFRFTFKEHNYCPNCGAKMAESEE